jgi:hypothetical protein
MTPTATTLALATGYLLTGVLVGAGLARRGQPSATALSALAMWPLLVPLLREAPEPAQPRLSPGPFAPRIDAALDALATIATEADGDVAGADLADLGGLRQALRRADHRLARVDRFIASEVAAPEDLRSEGAQRQLEALRAARVHAAAEIEGVLDQVAELRLQIGLVALSGGDDRVREQLAAIQSRIAALDEVGRV